MPRPRLIHFKGALFHITARGVDKKDIFLKPQDCSRYLERLNKVKKEKKFSLYSYCLMPNHIHLLIQVNKTPISRIMQALQTGHTMFFNKKYDHKGHVFQDRYYCILVEKESYLMELSRYIHLNPKRAGLEKKVGDYPWSSYDEILNGAKEPLVEREEILAFFSDKKEKQVPKFEEFVKGGIDIKRDEIFSEVVRDYLLGSNKFVKLMEKRLIKQEVQG